MIVRGLDHVMRFAKNKKGSNWSLFLYHLDHVLFDDHIQFASDFAITY